MNRSIVAYVPSSSLVMVRHTPGAVFMSGSPHEVHGTTIGHRSGPTGSIWNRRSRCPSHTSPRHAGHVSLFMGTRRGATRRESPRLD